MEFEWKLIGQDNLRNAVLGLMVQQANDVLGKEKISNLEISDINREFQEALRNCLP
jgi:hypothetical protein